MKGKGILYFYYKNQNKWKLSMKEKTKSHKTALLVTKTNNLKEDFPLNLYENSLPY